jgi:hypothetical protein
MNLLALTTLEQVGMGLGILVALGTLAGFIAAAVWWASSMFHETKAGRVATEQCVEVLKDVKVEVRDVQGRVMSLEEWQRSVRAREATHSTVIFGADELKGPKE